MHGQHTASGKYVTVYNRTRERFVASRARVADGYFSRLIGLLGTTRSWAQPGAGLWIVPSHGVHMIGMLYALDLIFLDRRRQVVDVVERIRPFRISKVNFKAHSVLELPVGTLRQSETQVGDQLEISPEISPVLER